MSAMQQSLIATAAALADTLDTPEFISTGAFTFSINAITVAAPEAYIDGDLIVLVLGSAAQTIADPTTGGTWIAPRGFVQSGTSSASGSTRCQVYYKIASGTQATAAVADSGSITYGQMFVFRKIDSTTPINGNSASTLGTAGTTHTLTALSTTVDKCMIAHCSGIGRDVAATINYSSPTNANLTDLTVRASRTVTDGAGGGVGMVTGVKAVAGNTGSTTVTVAGNALGAFITLGIAPSTNYNGTNRVIGAYGDVSDYEGLFSGLDAFAEVTLNTDGTITIVGDSGFSGGWFNNPSSGIGSSYWVRATTVSGSGSGTTGSWLALSTARSWSVGAAQGGNFNSWVLKLEFSTNSSGTVIVATTQLTLSAQTEVDTIAL